MSSNVFNDPVFKIVNIFCISPPYDFKTHKLTHKIIFKSYGVLLTGLVLVAAAFSYYKLHQQMVYVSSLLEGLEFLVITTCLFLFMVTVLGSCFWNEKMWETLFNLISHTEWYVVCSRRYFLSTSFLCLSVGSLLWIFLFVFIFYFLGIYFSEHILIFYVPRHIQMCLMYNILIVIRKKYKTISDTLVDINFCTIIKTSTVKNLQEIRKIYVETDRIVETFNAVFGWTMLLLLAQTVASALLFLAILTDRTLILNMKRVLSNEVINANIFYTIMCVVSTVNLK